MVDPLGMAGSKLQVDITLIITPSINLKNIEKAAQNAGVKVKNKYYSALIGARYALNSTEKELGAIYIDIGGTTTNICIYNESSPVFVSSIPIGGNHVTNDLAIGLRLSLAEAEQLKTKLQKNQLEREFSTEGSNIELEGEQEQKKISTLTATNGIIRPRLEELFYYLSEELSKSGYRSLVPAGIVLSGGGAYTPLVKDVCQKTLGLPVRIATPENIDGIIDDIRTANYTSTIALLNEAAKETYPTKKNNKISDNTFFTRLKKVLEPFIP